MVAAKHNKNLTFSFRLQKLRHEHGLTQRQLAKRIGVDSGQVSRYEAGKAVPRPEVMLRIAVELYTTLEYLRDGITEEDTVHEIEQHTGKPLKHTIAFNIPDEIYEEVLRICQITKKPMMEVIHDLIFLGVELREKADSNKATKKTATEPKKAKPPHPENPPKPES